MFLPLVLDFVGPDHSRHVIDFPEGSEIGIPGDQVMCAQRVVDATRKHQKIVRVVDVNATGGTPQFEPEWFGPDDVLPVLVRSDGARLVGAGDFSPRALDRFLSGA